MHFESHFSGLHHPKGLRSFHEEPRKREKPLLHTSINHWNGNKLRNRTWALSIEGLLMNLSLAFNDLILAQLVQDILISIPLTPEEGKFPMHLLAGRYELGEVSGFSVELNKV